MFYMQTLSSPWPKALPSPAPRFENGVMYWTRSRRSLALQKRAPPKPLRARCLLRAKGDVEDAYGCILRCREDAFFISSGFLKRHPSLSPTSRRIAVEWMLEFSQQLHFHIETYYLAVRYVDVYLARVGRSIERESLQTLCIACLFIASKLEEVSIPSSHSLQVESVCTPLEIVSFERDVVSVLKWQFLVPTFQQWLSYYFIREYPQFVLGSGSAGSNTKAHPPYPVAVYTEVSDFLQTLVLDVSHYTFPCSLWVASALYAARRDSKTCYTLTGYSYRDMKWCLSYFKSLQGDFPLMTS